MARKIKSGWLGFRCPEEWKRRVSAALALKGLSLQRASVTALSRYLRIDPPEGSEASKTVK